jgi:hypothetical protein
MGEGDLFQQGSSPLSLAKLHQVQRTTTQGPVRDDCVQGAAGHHQGPLQSVLHGQVRNQLQHQQ